MKLRIIFITLVLLLVPLLSAAGNNWELYFADGTLKLNGTDVCLDDGTCMTDLNGSASGGVDGNASSICADGEVLLGEDVTSCVSLNGTIDARIPASAANNSWNESRANLLYAPIGSGSDNASWNESRANILYTNKSYVDASNNTLVNWINSIFLTISTFNAENSSIWTAINNVITRDEVNSSIIDLGIKAGFNSSSTDTNDSAYIAANQAAWLSTYNATYDKWNYNQTNDTFTLWNSTWDNRLLIKEANDSMKEYVDTEIAGVSGANASWNQSWADTLYASIMWAYNQTIGTFNLYNSTWDNRALIKSTNESMAQYVNAEDLSFNSSMKDYVDAQIAGVGADNVSWNESRAKILFTNQTYIDNQDTSFNTSMKNYVDSIIAGINTTANIASLNFSTGNHTSASGGSNWGTNNTNLYNDTAAQVGIGTTTPTAGLHLINKNLEVNVRQGEAVIVKNTTNGQTIFEVDTENEVVKVESGVNAQLNLKSNKTSLGLLDVISRVITLGKSDTGSEVTYGFTDFTALDNTNTSEDSLYAINIIAAGAEAAGIFLLEGSTLGYQSGIMALVGDVGYDAIIMGGNSDDDANAMDMYVRASDGGEPDATDQGYDGGDLFVSGGYGTDAVAANANGGSGGDIYVYGGNAGAKDGSGTDGSQGTVYIGYNGTGKAGNVAIGGSANGEELYVTGDINATGDICITGGNCLSTVTGDNVSWNESRAKILFTNQTYVDNQDTSFNTSMQQYVDAQIAGVAGDNASWNESRGDILYTNKSYVDTTNSSLFNFIDTLYLRIATFTAENSSIWTAIGLRPTRAEVNSSIIDLGIKAGFNDSSVDTNDSAYIASNEASWLNMSNMTYEAWAYNQTIGTFNQYNSTWDNRLLIKEANDSMKNYVDAENVNQTSWVQSIFLTIATFNAENSSIWAAIGLRPTRTEVNSSIIDLGIEAGFNDSSVDYTNIAFTNNSNTFAENQVFSKNISQGDNDYHCFGDACDSYIYFNGSSLIMGVG